MTGIDTTAGSVTLDNGKVYSVSASAASMVMVGDLVTVTYTADASGKLNASDVEEAFPVSWAAPEQVADAAHQPRRRG